MRRDVRAYLEDILQSCSRIAQYVEGKDYSDYLADNMLRSAVEREFITVGEALTQMLQQQPDVAHRITNFRLIISFRNRLVHGYMDVDHPTVWGAVEEDLPILRAQTQALLQELDAKAGDT